MSTILVTGGAGFIGTHFSKRAIDAGHRVRILDNLSPQIHGRDVEPEIPSEIDFVRGDVTVREDWEKTLPDVDCVVHLAAETGTGQSMYQIDRYYSVNVQGTALLFDILANSAHSVDRVILASSRSVYGEGAYVCRLCAAQGRRCFPEPRLPEQLASRDWSPRCPDCNASLEPVATREDDRLSPASIYAATKLAQEQLVGVACKAMGIAHSILRFQNVFGEGQSLRNPYTGILSIFSTRIRLGLGLPIFEDGEETRDFVHVEDVANALLSAMAAADPAGAILNVGSGEPTTVMQVATLLCRVMGSDILPHVTGEYRVGDIRNNFADIDRLRTVTGFKPSISLQTGLERFCKWVAEQPVPADMLEHANAELKGRRLMG
jgi:dTDP-L-rhamnose 4-epimerase